jgi:hypothetical protein
MAGPQPISPSRAARTSIPDGHAGGPLKGFGNDCVTPSEHHWGWGAHVSTANDTSNACGCVGAAPRQRRALDAAGLILELEMAALVRRAGDSLRQDRHDADRRERRSWWRRLFGG